MDSSPSSQPGASANQDQSPLVGTWKGVNQNIVFNGDGTGVDYFITYKGTKTRPFAWSLEGQSLHTRFRSERWDGDKNGDIMDYYETATTDGKELQLDPVYAVTPDTPPGYMQGMTTNHYYRSK